MAADTFIESGKTYTILTEMRNCIGTPDGIYASTGAGDTRLPSSANQVSNYLSGSYTHYDVLTAKDATGTTPSRPFNFRIDLAAGNSFSCDVRVSLYEGEYGGPYKPYVDQTLSNRVKTAETSIEQNAEAIALRATKTEVQQVRPAYASSSTAAGTAAKVATIDPAVTGYALYKGATVAVTFSTANTAATPTLNLNSTGAKQIRSYTGAALSEAEYKWAAGATIDLVYDGTYWRMQDGGSVKRVTAAEASIRVNAENINLKVSKDGVISSINQSAETVKIQASKVEIDGTAVFNAAKSKLDAAYDAKGAASTAETNAKNYTDSMPSYKVISTTYNYSLSKWLEYAAEGYQDSWSQAKPVKVGDTVLIKGTASDTGESVYLLLTVDTVGSSNQITKATSHGLIDPTAGQRADSIQVGGRNLLQDSDQVLENGSVLDTKTLFACFLWSTPAKGYTGYKQIMPYTNVNSVGRFALTFEAMDVSQEYWCIKHNGTQHDYARYFKNSVDVKQGDVLTLSFDVVKFNPSVANGLEIKNFKLERGNKATDWSPAPEDIEANAVKRTQRIWYRKSASGAPSTPGTASSNWVTKADDGNDAWTKMHIAINSTHKYIYTCEQYEMANGTVGYTSVLLDNTITVIDGGNIITGTVTANKLNAANINASKTLTVGAMTDAAASTILNSNVLVGGRNLALDSKLVSHDAVASAPYAGMYSTAPKVERSDGFVAIAPKQGGNWTGLVVYMDSLGLAVGDSVAFSCLYEYQGCNGNLHFYAMSTNSSGTRIYPTFDLIGSNGYDGNYHSVTNLATISSTNKSGKVWVVAKWSQAAQDTIDAGGHVRFTFQVSSNTEVTSGGSVHLYATKLEKGNKATDWTPAPEDMATAESLAGTNESLEGAIEDIGELSDQLVGTVTEQNKTITNIQTYLNSLRKDLDAEIQSRQQWLNFNAAEGLVIGAAGSTFKTVTTNTSQQFRSGGTILAETSGTEFLAPVMRSDQIFIGNWMWTRRDNGNLSLKWIG